MNSNRTDIIIITAMLIKFNVMHPSFDGLDIPIGEMGLFPEL